MKRFDFILHFVAIGIFIWGLFFPVQQVPNEPLPGLRVIQLVLVGAVWVYYVIVRPWNKTRKARKVTATKT